MTAAQLTLPAEARTSFNNALKLFAKKDFDAARGQVVRALQICPRFAAALTLRGVLRVVGSQDQQAREDFRMALKIDPSYSLAYIGLAADYNLTGQFDQALNILRESAPFTARLWQSHFEASKALFAKGLFSRAIHEANQASLLYGRDMPDLHLIKAASYLRLKQNNDAIMELRRYFAYKRGPDANKMRKLLATVHYVSVWKALLRLATQELSSMPEVMPRHSGLSNEACPRPTELHA